jgi:hypothetical protein
MLSFFNAHMRSFDDVTKNSLASPKAHAVIDIGC